VASTGRFLLAATGQEPRTDRWARDAQANNGILLHTLAGEPDASDGSDE